MRGRGRNSHARLQRTEFRHLVRTIATPAAFGGSPAFREVTKRNDSRRLARLVSDDARPPVAGQNFLDELSRGATSAWALQHHAGRAAGGGYGVGGAGR